jgi:hypothetical protein
VIFALHPKDIDALANRFLTKYGHKRAQIGAHMKEKKL